MASMSVVLTGILLICMCGALLQTINIVFAQAREFYQHHYHRDMMLVDVVVVILYALVVVFIGFLYVFCGYEPLIIYGALVIFGMVMVVLFVRYCLSHRESINRTGVLLVLAWFVAALYLTLFSRIGGSGSTQVVSTPFRFLEEMVQQRTLEPMKHFMQNVLLFVPLGYFLPNIDQKHLHHAGIAVLGGIMLSTAIEGIQMFAHLGFCDIDDIIANSLGAAVGYLFCRLVWQIKKNWVI